MKKERIDIRVPTDPEDSIVRGRNGTYYITTLRVCEMFDGYVSLEGIGKRGFVIRGGLCVTKKCFEEMCRAYLAQTVTDTEAHKRELEAGYELSAALNLVQRAAWIVNTKAEGETNEKRQGGLTSVYYDLGRAIGTLDCLERKSP
jgi:hypothetical protein